MSYPWYEILTATNEIRQGDFIDNCPLIKPPDELNLDQAETVQFSETLTIKTLNTVVLSQSCDLEHEKIEIVLVCPYYTTDEFLNGISNQAERRKRLKDLKQGHLPSYHLIDKDESSNVATLRVVDFRNVYGVSYSFLKHYAKSIQSRPRLLPPYREHLSQAFARFFMRVGLPNDISID